MRAEAVEYHRADLRLGIDVPAGRPHHTLQSCIDPEVPPEFMEGENIAEAESRLLNDLGCGVLGPPDGPVKPVDERIQPRRRDLVEAPEIGHDARTDLAAVVSKGLDQLQVLAASGLGDTCVHSGATLSCQKPSKQYMI
jgi:hypothetical protein